MLTSLHVRRALMPVLLTGLLTTTTLASAPQAAAAQTGASRSDQTEQAASPATPDPVPPYRIVPGLKLKAKPPPWVIPVAGYRLTGRFGASSGLWASSHTGLDFAAVEGAEIRSIGPGVVTQASYDGAFGNKTVVRLDDGTVLWYAHQSELGVEVGERVVPGELIGHVGSTGNSTGPHLHLEVHPRGGSPIDPEGWLAAHDLSA